MDIRRAFPDGLLIFAVSTTSAAYERRKQEDHKRERSSVVRLHTVHLAATLAFVGDE
jgi:hypothetical protein